MLHPLSLFNPQDLYSLQLPYPMHILNTGIWFLIREEDNMLIFKQIQIFPSLKLFDLYSYKILFKVKFYKCHFL